MNLSHRWHFAMIILSVVMIALYLTLHMLQYPYATYSLFILLAIAGVPLMMQIFIKLLNGNFGADILAALALISGVLLQEYLACAFIILMLASGQALERYAMRKASSVLLALEQRMPLMAHKQDNGQIIDVNLTDIEIDDKIIVYPHETCPVDGTVIEGHGSMDESYLTGEPYLIQKAPGASVLSGALNGDSLLLIKTTQLTSHSRYASIVSVLTEAEQKRPSIRRLGDKIAGAFAPIALLFATCAWYFSGEAIRFLAVLVIATPCPLLIAIPVTIISAISKAAKRSIIIKDPTVLEQLPTCKTAIFDKTGTLTYGRPTLTDIVLINDMTEERVLQYVASLERYSKHPLSFAILNSAKQKGMTLLETSHVSEIPGQGLQGMINHQKVQVTGRKQLLKNHPEFKGIIPLEQSGLECMVMIDDQLAATLHFHDLARPEAKSFISHLQPAHQFSQIMIVSGDRESEVKYLADHLNIHSIYASQTPEQKLAIVRQEVKNNPTIFMGDGINDAPALTAATVGIAFGEFSNVSAEAASAVIMENTFNKVDELFHLSLDTRKIILQSALGGMGLSLIGMTFAAMGYISPVAGAIIQEIIDILAIINALRLTFESHIKIDLPT